MELGGWAIQIFIRSSALAGEEYRILINMGNKIEYVHGLANITMEYVLLSRHSPHSFG